MNTRNPIECVNPGDPPSERHEQHYPATRFAAVVGVQYAMTNDRQPLATFNVGGVMLSELYPGEVAIITVGSSYQNTVDSMMLSYTTEIITDNPRQEVRFSAPVRSAGEIKSWTYLRFADRAVYARFNRILWDLYDRVSTKEMLIHSRLAEVAYDLPSNFTKYCRQYLGEDYFDKLPDDEDGHTLAGESVAEYTEEAHSNADGEDGEGNGSEDEDELIPVVHPDEMW
ncbi:hypothetical protein C8T65DRAFT_745667 [Cerioporus squamosus]|nr:hypothetical protein C8T65DRAFT_745667 [Cerioporus squamosus]